jgi:uncharacterized protein YeaO (DUF488 family)
MALRQTYLSLKDKLPADAEVVLVMHGRGNDELAPSKELLDEFNEWKAKFTPDSGYETALHYAWDKSSYEARFRAQIAANPKSAARLKDLAGRATTRDVFLICYEGYDKPCHRHLLLAIARDEFGAPVDPAPFVRSTPACDSGRGDAAPISRLARRNDACRGGPSEGSAASPTAA